MTPRMLVLAGIAALTITACNKPEAPAETAAPVEATADAAPVEQVAAPMVEDAPKPEGSFSAAALAGHYEGEGMLMLNADGTFNHTVGDATTDGTWGQEPSDPTRVRLDPNSKAAKDQLLQVVSNDELKPVTGDNAMTPTSDKAFKRAAMP